MFPHKTAWWEETHKQLSVLCSERIVLRSQILNKASMRKKIPNHRERKGKQYQNPAMARKNMTDYINDSF